MVSLEFQSLLAKYAGMTSSDTERMSALFVDIIKDIIGGDNNIEFPLASLGFLSVTEHEQEILFDADKQKYCLIPPKFVVCFTPADSMDVQSDDSQIIFTRQNLIDAIIERNPRLSVSDVEKFLNSFALLVKEAIERDGSVSVSGLGSFELLKPEGSDGNAPVGGTLHFTPTLALRDYVNLPLSHLEPVELDNMPVEQDDTPNQSRHETPKSDFPNPLNRLASEAAGIQNLLSEIAGLTPQEPTPEPTEEPKSKESKTANVANVAKAATIADEPKKTDPKNAPNQETEIQENMKNQTQKSQKQQEKEMTAAVEALNRENNSELTKSNALWIAVVVVLAVVIVALLAYKGYDSFFANKGAENVENIVVENENAEADAENIIAEDSNVDIEPYAYITADVNVGDETLPKPNFEMVDKSSEIYAEGFSDIFNAVRNYEYFLATETVGKGGRLTLISLKYYAHKDFWVYIYEANRDILSNPDDVKANTRIKVPVLNQELIDPENPECLRYARFLHDIYVKK